MAAANTERDAKIAAAARLGQSHEAIAKEHGITRARVSQIVAAAKTPAGPEEAQRQLIAERLRSRWDVLEKIVREPPEQHSAIGRPVIGSDGRPIINAQAVIAAVREQLKIETQFRALFGVDLATRPGPLLDERQMLMAAEIRVAQMYQATHAPLALPALPPNYHALSPEDQAEADLTRRRGAHQAQQAAIAAAVIPQPGDDDIAEAEIVG